MHSVSLPCPQLLGSPDLFSQALLGIATYPDDSIDHPEAPLLNAGTRRQSACDALVAQALTLGYEEGIVDVPTRDNLAALLALIQMMMCA